MSKNTTDNVCLGKLNLVGVLGFMLFPTHIVGVTGMLPFSFLVYLNLAATLSLVDEAES